MEKGQLFEEYLREGPIQANHEEVDGVKRRAGEDRIQRTVLKLPDRQLIEEKKAEALRGRTK